MKNRLKNTLAIQTYSHRQFRMFAYIIRQLNQAGCEYYVYNGCIYATKGQAEFYPCIVSHMDTVHEIAEDLTVLEVRGKFAGFNAVTMQSTGIGGDDKVGIFIALECIRNFDNIKAVFFRDEEVGCQGSYDPDLAFFLDCGFVLQCDRKGYGDFVTSASGTKLSSKAFQKALLPLIQSYGYSYTKGYMTDVMALKQSGIACSMANISCGYYEPHTEHEYVHIAEVFTVLNMVMDIIAKFSGTFYECQAPKKEVNTWLKEDKWLKSTAKYDLFAEGHQSWRKKYCDCCYEPANLTRVDEYGQDMCDKCIKQYVTYYDV